MKTKLQFLFLMILLAGFGSCGSSDDDGKDVPGNSDGLVLVADRDTIRASGTDVVKFTLTYDGKDVTSAAKIIETKTLEVVKGGEFTTTKTGEYTFLASYNSINSKELKVRVIPELLFRKNALLTFFTSTNCPNCPRMDDIIKSMLVEEPERLNVIAVHGPVKKDDPLQVPAIFNALSGQFSIRESPSVLIDQAECKVGIVEMDDVKSYLTARGDVGIALETSSSGNRANIKVTLRASKSFDFPCALAVALVEDGKVSPQDRNGVIEPDYVHDHVVRSYNTDIFGDRLEANALGKDKEIVKEYKAGYDGSWAGFSVIAYVVNANTNQVLNSQRVKIGQSVGFQYVEYIVK